MDPPCSGWGEVHRAQRGTSSLARRGCTGVGGLCPGISSSAAGSRAGHGRNNGRTVSELGGCSAGSRPPPPGSTCGPPTAPARGSTAPSLGLVVGQEGQTHPLCSRLGAGGEGLTVRCSSGGRGLRCPVSCRESRPRKDPSLPHTHACAHTPPVPVCTSPNTPVHTDPDFCAIRSLGGWAGREAVTGHLAGTDPVQGGPRDESLLLGTRSSSDFVFLFLHLFHL